MLQGGLPNATSVSMIQKRWKFHYSVHIYVSTALSEFLRPPIEHYYSIVISNYAARSGMTQLRAIHAELSAVEGSIFLKLMAPEIVTSHTLLH